MKKTILLWVFFQSTVSAACMCSVNLHTAFNEIENKIFTENVMKMNVLLETTNDKVQDNIDDLKKRIVIYTKHIKINTLHLKEIINAVKKEQTLIRVDK